MNPYEVRSSYYENKESNGYEPKRNSYDPALIISHYIKEGEY